MRARASDPGGTHGDGPVPLRADYGRSACGVLDMLQDRMWHTRAARVSEDDEGGFASLFSALESLIRQNVKKHGKTVDHLRCDMAGQQLGFASVPFMSVVDLSMP